MAAARASILKRLEQVLDKHGTIHVLRRGFSEGGDSVDLVLFVNGVPTATAELKNRWTGQTVEDAIEQYRTSRDPKIVLFARRAFVHFAIDAELAYLTTRLAKAETVVLPLNQGSNGPGRPGGKGNPGAEDGHALPPVARRRRMPDPRAAARRRTQLPHLALGGLGQDEGDCLVAHELSSLHADDDTKVFDKVFVITDRRVLDRQLRDQIAQFEQVAGVVRSVQESSKELREALLSKQAKVVTTTLQKFPFVLQALDEADESVKDRRYAVIVDEAHSSQTGDSATDLKAVLGSVKPDELDLDEDDGTPAILLARLAARGKQPNLSFFAFTATPKGKTLELFGRREPHSDTLAAFHTYSMRQAIEEGFIVDVLRNYTTFDQLARLETEADKALEVPKSRTSSFFSRFVDLHPYVKSQKAAIVVEHFKRVVRPLLEGQGKAMVVNRYVRFYSFLAQVLPYIPADAEVLFQFSRVLLKRLLSVRPDGGVNLSGIVELTHFRLEEIGTEQSAFPKLTPSR